MESLKRELGDDKRVREVLEQIIENPEGAESTLKEYGLNPAVYRTAMSISPESHVRMQGGVAGPRHKLGLEDDQPAQ